MPSDLMVCDRARIPSTKKYMDSKRLMYSWENICGGNTKRSKSVLSKAQGTRWRLVSSPTLQLEVVRKNLRFQDFQFHSYGEGYQVPPRWTLPEKVSRCLHM